MNINNNTNPLNPEVEPQIVGVVTPPKSSSTDEKSHDVATAYFQTLPNPPVGSGLSAIRGLKGRNIKQEAAAKSESATSESSTSESSTSESSSSEFSTFEPTTRASESSLDSNFYQTDLREVRGIIDNLVNKKPIKKKSKLAELAESKWSGANRTINNLVRDHLGKYYEKGCTKIQGTIKDKFDRMTVNGKKVKAEFVNIEEGISDTKLVTLNGKNAYVVKKLALPKVLMQQPKIKEQLATIFVEGLKNYGGMVKDLDNFLTVKIGDFFDKLIAPYYTGANREKMAELVGKGLRVYVPEVEIVKTSGDNVYTCHQYIENKGTLKEVKSTPEIINQQSMQDIYILDALLKNVDRHLNNIIFSKDNKAIPIDHSLSLQGSNKSNYSTMYSTFQNNSLSSIPSHANLPLTKESIEKIHNFDVVEVIANATIVKELILEADVKSELTERAERAKEAIKIPGITAHQFVLATIVPKCLVALQGNSKLTADELVKIVQMN